MGCKQFSSAYTVILAMCVAGALHLSWWWVCAGACSLTLISLLAHHTAAYPQFRNIGEPILVASSVINGVTVATGAFLFGYLARWLWGL